MDVSEIAAWSALLVSVIGAVFAGLASLRNGRKIDVVQGTVNGQQDRIVARNDQLTAKLTEHGIVVPPTPAPVDEHPAP